MSQAHSLVLSNLRKQFGKTEIIRGVDLSVNAGDGATPLLIACQNGHLSIVSMLLEKDPDLIRVAKRGGFTPFYVACEHGYTDIATLLYERDPGVVRVCQDDGASPLLIACQNGHPAIVSLLIEKDSELMRIPKTLGGFTPLYIACEYDHVDVVSLLIEKDSTLVRQTTKTGNSPMHIACEKGLVNVVSLLMNSPYTMECLLALNADGRSPIHSASCWGHADVCRVLFLRDSSFILPNIMDNIFDDAGMNVISLAGSGGHITTVRYLLSMCPSEEHQASAITYADSEYTEQCISNIPVREWQRQCGLQGEYLQLEHTVSVLLLSECPPELQDEDDSLPVLLLREVLMRQTNLLFLQSERVAQLPIESLEYHRRKFAFMVARTEE